MSNKLKIGIIAIFSLFFIQCRSVVNPNEWVISTGTCWNTMTVSKAGDMIPRLYTACDRMIILPATEMGMELECETKFANRVAGKVSITGQWKIVNPELFIQSAKSIVSSPTDGDHKIDVNALEAIENGVVDKILIDIIREYTPTKEAGLDEKVLETELGELAKQKVSKRGVEYSNMSANINFDGQTEEALGVISALKFYKSNGEEEFGKEVIKAKAGAPHITVQPQITVETEE